MNGSRCPVSPSGENETAGRRCSATKILPMARMRRDLLDLPFAQWTKVFGEAALTAALLDRLTHCCFIHEFSWESIRFEESMKRTKKSKKAVNRAVAATAPLDGAEKVKNQEGAPNPS